MNTTFIHPNNNNNDNNINNKNYNSKNYDIYLYLSGGNLCLTVRS